MQSPQNATPRLVLKAQASFYFWMLPLAIIIVVAGVSLIEQGSTQAGFLLLLLSLFFLIPTVAGIYLSIVPAYIVDFDGIKVRKIGLFRWTEIAKIDLVTVNGFTLIGVTTQNGTTPKNSLWRRLNPASKAWPHRDLYLPLFLVSSPPQKIVETISSYKEVARG